MSQKPIIVVTGANSKQGGSIAHSLLDTGRYHVKAIVKRPETIEAKNLAKKGSELFIGDSSDKATLEKAFHGAYGVYLMTPIFGPKDADKEIEVGKLQADVAVASGVKHILWSGLEHVGKITKEKLVVPHFTSKAIVQEYLDTLKGITVTSIYCAYFLTNLIEYYSPKLVDGVLTFQLPIPGDKPAPFLDPTKSPGVVAVEIFDNPSVYSKRIIAVLGELISPNQMMETFTKVTGIPAKYKQITDKKEWFKATPMPEDMADEVWQMFEFSTHYGYYRSDRDLAESRAIEKGKARTWEQFLRETQWKGESWAEWKLKQ